jgi:X-X-X-Leu-X-X-Gly heptad repeat protein
MSTLQRLMKMASKALDASGQSKTSSSGGTDWRGIVRTAADKVTGDARQPGANAGSAHPAPSGVQDAPAYNAPAGDVPVYGTPASTAPVQDAASSQGAAPEDRAAIARYDYLVKTAMPEQLEQVHRDAFARLTSAQRQQVESRLHDELPASERPVSSSPDDLARAAVRGEAHKPGFLRGVFSKPGAAGAAGAVAGVGVGAVAGGLLAAVAGGAVLSSVAGPLLEQASGMGIDFDALGGLEGGLENGIGEAASGAGEYASGLGEHVSELGSNFEIPGLGNLGGLFGRD